MLNKVSRILHTLINKSHLSFEPLSSYPMETPAKIPIHNIIGNGFIKFTRKPFTKEADPEGGLDNPFKNTLYLVT